MKVFIEKSQKTVDCKPDLVISVLKNLDINPQTVLVVKNGVLVPEDEVLIEDDEIKVLSVISGG